MNEVKRKISKILCLLIVLALLTPLGTSGMTVDMQDVMQSASLSEDYTDIASENLIKEQHLFLDDETVEFVWRNEQYLFSDEQHLFMDSETFEFIWENEQYLLSDEQHLFMDSETFEFVWKNEQYLLSDVEGISTTEIMPRHDEEAIILVPELAEPMSIILTINPTTNWTNIAAAGGAQRTVTVTTNVPSVGVTGPGWLTAQSVVGGIRFTALQNPIAAPRSGTVTCTAGAVSRSFTVSQLAAATTLAISPTTNWTGISAAGGAQRTVTVTSNAASVGITGPGWLTAQSVVGGIRLTALQNPIAAPRSGIVTFTAGTISRSFTVSQLAAATTLTISPATNWTNIPAAGGAQRTVTITSNAALIDITGPGWLTAQSVAGGIRLTAQQNPIAAPRSGTVTFTANNVTRSFTVSQLAGATTLTINPATNWTNIPAAGGAQRIVTVTSNAPSVNVTAPGWLTMQSVAGGVRFTALQSNASTTRSGTVTFTANNVSRSFSVSQLGNSLSFSAFLIGYGTHCPASLVNRRLSNLNFTNNGTFNNHTGNFASASTIRSLGRESDVVFIAGHGANAAAMLVQNVDANSAGRPGVNQIELLSAVSGLTNPNWFQPVFHPVINNQTTIGANFFTGSTTRTNSYWSDRTRWAIFYSCSQLNFGPHEGNGNYWYGRNSAQIWARTMLGYPNRMHGILGFFNMSPSSTNPDTGYAMLQDFLSLSAAPSGRNCIFTDLTIIHAWIDAHNGDSAGRGRANWAAIFHFDNYYDRFYDFIPRTSNTEEPRISILSRGTLGQRNISLGSSEINGLPTESTFSASELAQYMATDFSFNASEFIPSISLDFSNNVLSDVQQDTITRLLMADGYHGLRFDNDGSIAFRNADIDFRQPNIGMQMTHDQAVEVARGFLRDLDLLPTDSNYRTIVSEIHRSHMNVLTGDYTNPETVEFTVQFVRQINGIDLFSYRGDGILISFNNNGITGLHHNWRDMDITQTQSHVANDHLSAEQAAGVFLEMNREHFAHHGLPASLNMSKAYVLQDGIVTRAWVFSEEHDLLNMVMIDAVTSERIYAR